ncbi:MAG: ABC transporter permease [Anaerolineales bacterium]|nr:ABC transporter permease [Anaerolineales bacterium]
MQLSEPLTATRWRYWQIVLTLAAKDIVDALKNKTTLTIVLGLGMMMLTVEALPLLLKLDSRPRLAIYDAARSTLADELRREGDVQVMELRAAEDAAAQARQASSPLLAVSLPADWADSSGPLLLTGYLGHWLSAAETATLVRAAEANLGRLTGRSVTIQPETVYPTLEQGGHSLMVALGLLLAVTLITTTLVPYLILEEKSGHTLELLRVSPASVNQILLGKGLAGFVYGLVATAVLVAFNFSLINYWGLFLLTMVALILFGVGLGLLIGSLVENEGAVQMWVAGLIVVLSFPLMLAFLNSSRLPDWIQTVSAWLPTTAAFDLVRLSFGDLWPAGMIVARLASLLGTGLLIFLLAGWRLRRWES